jgi:hypothetical protein
MDASTRNWNFYCGCRGGADLSCAPGTSKYDDGSTIDTDWCKHRGVDFNDGICLRKGLACYKHNNDYDNSDANKAKCCAPFDDNMSASPGSPAAQTCPPGWCKGSQHCMTYLTNLCNTEDGLTNHTEVCKKFAFDNRSTVALSAVAGWCAKQIRPDGSSSAATMSTKPGHDGDLIPGGFCSCYNSKFAPNYKFTSSDTVTPDPIGSHPICFNSICKNYGYAVPDIINDRCPDVCMAVVSAVAKGNVSIDHNTFRLDCPGPAADGIDAATKKAADEAAMLKKMKDANDAIDKKLADLKAQSAADAKALADARAAMAAAAAAPPASSSKSTMTPTIIAVVVVLCAIGYMLSMRAGAHALSAVVRGGDADEAAQGQYQSATAPYASNSAIYA